MMDQNLTSKFGEVVIVQTSDGHLDFGVITCEHSGLHKVRAKSQLGVCNYPGRAKTTSYSVVS